MNPNATLADGAKLVQMANAKDYAQLNSILPSLLVRQLKDNFSLTTVRPDHVGFLTFVYPIAATTSGPFSIELPGIYHLGEYEGDEARWHSFKWNDEFGGLPFMQYTGYGIAFHGPITQFVIPSIEGEAGSFNFWYLRRGYVSHGCHRMDPNDIMELRTLLPAKILSPGKSSVQVVSKVYPDSDELDGRKVVFNVDYYTPTVEIRKNETLEQAVERNSVVNQRVDFLNNKIVALRADPSSGKKIVSIEDLKADTILFDGVSGIDVLNGKVVEQASNIAVELKNYPFRGTRIIQYEEAGVRYNDGSTNDDFGRFPPGYFNQRKYLK